MSPVHEQSPIRVGICGRAGAGKTTLAEALRDALKATPTPKTVVCGFADKLKEVCRDVYGMRGKDRKLLQDVGTALRSVRSSVWIDYLVDTHVLGNCDNVVVHDVRYPNEADALLEHGFILVHLSVDRKLQESRGRVTGHSHASETSTDALVSRAAIHGTSRNRDDLERLVSAILKEHASRMRWDYGVVS